MTHKRQSAPNKEKVGHGKRKGSSSSSGKSRAQGPGNKHSRSKGSNQPRKHFDRYTALALAAAASGDAVQSEYYYQHAEHYLRVLKKEAA